MISLIRNPVPQSTRLVIIFPSYRSWALLRDGVIVHAGRSLWWLKHRRWSDALLRVALRGGQVRAVAR